MLVVKSFSFFKSLSTRTKIILACGIPFLLMLSISMFEYQSIKRTAETARWVEHTHKVIADSNELMKLLIDMETGLRGYLITNNDVFLQPFNEARQVWDSKHQALKTLVSDNPVQVERLIDIEQRQKQWLTNVAEFKITERRNSQMPEQELMVHIKELVNQQTGKSMMDGIRQVKQDFIAMERDLMTKRQKASAQAENTTTFIVVIGTILTLIITILLAYIIASYIGNRLTLLLQGTERISKGDYNFILAVDDDKEFSALAHGFNLMTSSVNQSVSEMEKALQAKSDFLANMSHEIRTPMNGIFGMLTLLEDTNVSENQKEYISAIRSCGDGLLLVINDILDISKLEAGKLALEKDAFQLKGLIREVVFLLDNIASQKGLNVTSKIDGKLNDYYIGDKLRIRQILLNLINNAIKFSETGGIKVVVSRVTTTDPDDAIECKVIDQGIGISNKDQAKLFKPFSQVDESTCRKYGGTGLGLIICAKLVKQMGGAISVTSELNKGSTFAFTLPLPVGEKPQTNNNQSLSQYSADNGEDQQNLPTNNKLAEAFPLSILVAEDNKINQVIAKKLFNKLGYQVDIADNGEEAIKAANNQRYDVIFMDMQMPIMGGVTATENIIKAQPNDHPTIIAMTANVLESDRQNCFDAGMVGFIQKPIIVGKVIEAIKQIHTVNC